MQAMVPDELRGRVMSVYSMMFMGMAPLGALLAGFACRNFRRTEHRRARRRGVYHRLNSFRASSALSP